MQEFKEVKIEVGFYRNENKIINEIERICKDMVHKGWLYADNYADNVLSNITLIFERKLK
ncbi:MAG: hypothetical protein ABIA63_05315 [bacterium]